MVFIRFTETENLSKILKVLDEDGWKEPNEEDSRNGQPWHYRSKIMGDYFFQGCASGNIYDFDFHSKSGDMHDDIRLAKDPSKTKEATYFIEMFVDNKLGGLELKVVCED
jgi:hypothetical protein